MKSWPLFAIGAFISFFVGAAHAEVMGTVDPVAEESPVLQSLNLVYPKQTNLRNPVQVQLSVVDGVLRALFEVHTTEIYARERLGKGEYPFQFDVVEIFVSVNGLASPFPYYEFEVSPYGENFQVLIPGGKKPFKEGVNLGLKSRVRRVGGAWMAEMEIPLGPLGWDGDLSKIVGNAYAIIGKKPNRTFWGLTLPPQEKANFHKPEFFKPFFRSASPGESLEKPKS